MSWMPRKTIDEWRSLLRPIGRESISDVELKALFLDAAGKDEFWIAQFLIAAGLFSFGEYDQAFDMIRFHTEYYKPFTRQPWFANMHLIAQLLPLPEHLDPESPDHRHEIHKWLVDHEGKFVWSENDGRYVLKSLT